MANSKRTSVLLPGHAVVVRGGNNNLRQIERSIVPIDGTEGMGGLTVICGSEVPLEQLCQSIPHSVIRCTTVGAVRMAGGDVVASNGRSEHHATLIGIRGSNGQWAASLFDSGGGGQSTQDREDSMTTHPRVFADFHNADRLGRVRLNTAGAKEDLAKSRIELSDGMLLELYDDDEIVATGVVRHDAHEGWVAEVDWNAIG